MNEFLSAFVVPDSKPSVCSTQIQIPEIMAGNVRLARTELFKWAKENMLEAENNAHITVRYGILNQPGVFGKVAKIIQDFPVFRFSLGKIDRFSGVEGGTKDVLYISVHSPELVSLSARLASLASNAEKIRPYIPHLTLAYVKPHSFDWMDNGKVRGVTGQVLEVEWVNFCQPNRTEHQIELKRYG